MSEWIPFCFPKCPHCQQGWSKNFHRDCLFNGQLLVHPDQGQVRCDSCSQQWHVMDSQFYCACGYNFKASEVKNALSTAELLRQRLMQKLNEMDLFEISIKTKSQSSIKEWIGNISYEISRLVGTTVSQAKELIDKFFQNWL